MHKTCIILSVFAAPAFAQYPGDANLPPCAGPYDAGPCRSGVNVKGIARSKPLNRMTEADFEKCWADEKCAQTLRNLEERERNGQQQHVKGREMTADEFTRVRRWQQSGHDGPHPLQEAVGSAAESARAAVGRDMPPIPTLVCFGVAAVALVMLFKTRKEIRELENKGRK